MRGEPELDRLVPRRLSESTVGCQGARIVHKVPGPAPVLVWSMVILLCILAVAMIATGVLAMAFGMSIVQVERGWTMVISGTVGASAGVMLLGLAAAVHRLGRVAGEMVWIRDRLATIGEMTAAEAAGWQQQAEVPPEPDVASYEPAAAATEPPPPAPETRVERPPLFKPEVEERVIVGQYASGGNEYKMYSDGSIDAQTPAGLRRFGSLEELRAFVAGGGERAQ